MQHHVSTLSKEPVYTFRKGTSRVIEKKSSAEGKTNPTATADNVNIAKTQASIT